MAGTLNAEELELLARLKSRVRFGIFPAESADVGRLVAAIDRLVGVVEQQRELLDDFARLVQKADEGSGRYLGAIWHSDAAAALRRGGQR